MHDIGGILQRFAIQHAYPSSTAACSGFSQNRALPAGGMTPFQSMTVFHLPGGGTFVAFPRIASMRLVPAGGGADQGFVGKF